MPSPRSRSRRGLALAAACVMALVLSGCVGAPAGTESPSPSESTSPVFASDEEALAAAGAAYARYLKTVDLLTQGGGEDPERLNGVVTEKYAVELLDSLQRLRDSGRHTTGNTHYDGMRLLERNESEGSAQVSVLLCLDVSDVRVFDANGADVTPAERPVRSPIQAQFESSSEHLSQLLPSGSESWPGESFC
jgi:hypothetical protein